MTTSVRFWNDICQVTWERGNNPTNCRKNVQLQFNFTTAKNCTTAISFHNCEILCRNNRIKSTTAISFHNWEKLHNCKTNAQQQKNCSAAKQIYCNTNAEALMGYYLLINLFDDSVKKNASTLRPNFDAF